MVSVMAPEKVFLEDASKLLEFTRAKRGRLTFVDWSGT